MPQPPPPRATSAKAPRARSSQSQLVASQSMEVLLCYNGAGSGLGGPVLVTLPAQWIGAPSDCGNRPVAAGFRIDPNQRPRGGQLDLRQRGCCPIPALLGGKR